MKKMNWIREELSAVKKGAARNNEFAMHELATRYLTGRGVGRDGKAALYWACQGAVRGNPKSMVLAGYCLVRGIGSADEEPTGRLEEAVGWFEDAARLGNASAYYNLGGCFLRGIGKPRCKRAALLYYKEAAKMGCKLAEKAIAAVEASSPEAIEKAADRVRLLLAA